MKFERERVLGLLFFQDTENENGYCLLEGWENQEAVDEHFQSHTYGVLVGAMNLLSKKPLIHYCITEPLRRTKSGV